MNHLITLLLGMLALSIVASVLPLFGVPQWLVWPALSTALVVVGGALIVVRTRQAYFGRRSGRDAR